MNSDNETEILANFFAVGSLFITCPAAYILDVWMIYKTVKGDPGFSVAEFRSEGFIAHLGIFLLYVGVPLFHWYSYRYCQNKFGWFRKK